MLVWVQASSHASMLNDGFWSLILDPFVQADLWFTFDGYDINELIIQTSQLTVINCDTLAVYVTISLFNT